MCRYIYVGREIAREIQGGALINGDIYTYVYMCAGTCVEREAAKESEEEGKRQRSTTRCPYCFLRSPLVYTQELQKIVKEEERRKTRKMYLLKHTEHTHAANEWPR